MDEAARVAFEKWGDTEIEMESFAFHNIGGCFVPISRLNQVRRDLGEGLKAAVTEARAERVTNVVGWVESSRPAMAPRWVSKTDPPYEEKRHHVPLVSEDRPRRLRGRFRFD